MLPQEVRDAKQAVADYKKFNQNTVKQIVRRCPKTKAVFYETVKVDENASKFIEKYKKEAKKKKQEKHLGKQLMNAPKTSNINKNGETFNKVLNYVKMGKTPIEIQNLLGITASTVNYHIQIIKEKTDLKIKPSKVRRKNTRQYEENKKLFEQGLSFDEIIAKRNITKSTLYQSYASMKVKEGKKWVAKVKEARQKKQKLNKNE